MNATTFREYIFRHNDNPRNKPIQRLRFKREVEAYYPMNCPKGLRLDVRA